MRKFTYVEFKEDSSVHILFPLSRGYQIKERSTLWSYAWY